jgi:hypothetical protein
LKLPSLVLIGSSTLVKVKVDSMLVSRPFAFGSG